MDFRALADDTSPCLTNHYKDGNDCKECPVGYFGDNCTNICPSSYFGRLCVHECECSPCHYIYGCVKHVADTTELSNSYETTDETTGTNEMPETTIYEAKTEDKPNRSNQTPGNMKITDTILVISVGSLLCAMLIFVIIREFCLCCRLPQPVGRRTTRNDVYADIAEMQNERTLTD